MPDAVAIAAALLASLLFGFSVHFQQRALRDTDAGFGTLLTLITSTALLWLGAPFLVEADWWLTRAAAIFAFCGLFFPALSQTLQIESTRAVGPALAAAIGSFAPMFATIPAILFLGEALNLQGALGLALLIGGLALTGFGPGKGLPRAFPLVALLLPLGASFFRGIVQPISKVGFNEVPSPYFGALVMFSVSTVVVAGQYGLRWNRRAAQVSRRGTGYFLLNGLFIGVGTVALQAAISYGEVTVAAPLVSMTPLWAVFLGIFLFRNELLTARHVLIAFTVFLGAALIVMR